MVLAASGLVHGLWTDRWQPSTALVEATARVEQLPDSIGAWKSVPYEQDAQALEMAGATAHYSRSFLDPVTGDRVLVILMAGKASRMVVHRPEHCYTAAGYVLNGKPVEVKIQPKGLAVSEFASGSFSRDEATGPSQMRIYWSFFANDRWSVPSNPRWEFARERVLYKLYVLRNVAGSSRLISRDDPCLRLLGELLPILDQTLIQSREE